MLNRITEAVRAAARGGPAGPTDADLLDRFRRDRDGEAFAGLVRRHGRAVLAACRQILADPADVDDAFQATFLVLFRNVAAVEGATVGSWLYAVAHRLAVRVLSDARRRAEREGAAARQRTEVVPPEPSWRDAVAVLHEELDRLPDAYRRVLLLCYLRGRSREEAAAELGWSPGAVKGRLERGRRMLAARLTRRGIGLPAGLLAVVTGNFAGAGGPPPGLIERTVRAATGAPSPAAAALARGALPVTNVTKLATAGVAVGLAALVGFALWRADPPAAPAPAAEPVRAPAPAALDGRWRCVGMASDGEVSPRWEAEARRYTVTFRGDTLSAPLLLGDATFSRPAAPANAIDVRVKADDGRTSDYRGVYALDGDRLTLCLVWAGTPPGDARPTGFDTRPDDGRNTYVLERIPPGGPHPETAAEQWGVIAEAVREGKLDAVALEAHAARCVAIADRAPGTDVATVCLLWALSNAPDGPAGRAALAALKDGGIDAANVETLAPCFGRGRGGVGTGDIPDRITRELAPLLLARVRRTPDHPRAAELLSSVSWLSRADGPEVSPVFDGAARMIAERWTTSPYLTHFLETLDINCRLTWTGRYEPTVRAIRDRTPDSYLRHRAAYTLAKLVGEAGDARQEEARELFARFVKDADPAGVRAGVRELVKGMVEQARRELDALHVRGVGGPAPALAGLDLDGRPIALADYRGKVVLLSFWATWCGPCMRLVPHERALVERFKDRPFAVVGVNGDEVEKLDRKLIETHKITWRSFRDDRPGRPAISREWNVAAWPTLYLIDHAGAIRRRWTGAPPADELDRDVARWVAAAEAKPLAPPPGAVSAWWNWVPTSAGHAAAGVVRPPHPSDPAVPRSAPAARR